MKKYELAIMKTYEDLFKSIKTANNKRVASRMMKLQQGL